MVYKEIKVMKEVIEQHRYCDVCGDEINISLTCNFIRCMYCGKDLCDKCISHEENNYGSHRIVYCKKCWDLGEGILGKIEKLHNKIESLYQEWQDLCKE